MMHPYQGGLPLPSPATVKGLPLLPGERVIHFHSSRNIGLRILMFFMGIGLVVLLIGFVFLWIALTDQSQTTVVTNFRILTKSGNKPPAAIGLREITKIETRRGTRYRINEILVHGANASLQVPVIGNEALRDLVLAISKDPSVAEHMPPVPYLP